MPDKWQIVVVPCLIALRTLKGGWDSLLDDTTLLLLIFQLVSWCLYPALRLELVKRLKLVDTQYRAFRSKQPPKQRKDRGAK